MMEWYAWEEAYDTHDESDEALENDEIREKIEAFINAFHDSVSSYPFEELSMSKDGYSVLYKHDSLPSMPWRETTKEKPQEEDVSDLAHAQIESYAKQRIPSRSFLFIKWTQSVKIVVSSNTLELEISDEDSEKSGTYYYDKYAKYPVNTFDTTETITECLDSLETLFSDMSQLPNKDEYEENVLIPFNGTMYMKQNNELYARSSYMEFKWLTIDNNIRRKVGSSELVNYTLDEQGTIIELKPLSKFPTLLMDYNNHLYTARGKKLMKGVFLFIDTKDYLIGSISKVATNTRTGETSYIVTRIQPTKKNDDEENVITNPAKREFSVTQDWVVTKQKM